MAIDPIIECLKQTTDHCQFERFCTDLLRFDGYQGIEPLGGVADKSRDSTLQRNGENIIFHYSLRKDWKAKLWEDANGVLKHGHAYSMMVSVNPVVFTVTQRDTCIKQFEEEFGCPLVLYGVERVAVLLRSVAEPLLRKYPQIFVPDLVVENRHTVVEVRISPTREKGQQRQLAQIVAYNKGPGPILIEAWFGILKSGNYHESMECIRGRLPVRLEEKSKIDVLVSLDFDWEELVEFGVMDAENCRHDVPNDDVKRFIAVARQHMPPSPEDRVC